MKVNILTISILLTACSNPDAAPKDDAPIADEETEQARVTYRIDFGLDEEADDWFALNDDVMGGVSTGEVSYSEGSIVFDGFVSTDNNGGFVSIRSPNASYDLSDFTEIEISYRSQGHGFVMILADQNAWYEPKFELEVMPESAEWSTVTVALSEFKQYAMTGIGEVETGAVLSEEFLSDVLRIELMNTSFESGEFELEIDYIEFQGPID